MAEEVSGGQSKRGSKCRKDGREFYTLVLEMAKSF